MSEVSRTSAERVFEERVGPLVEPLRRYLVRRASPDLVDDVLSETLLVCWRRIDDLPAAEDDLRPWAYGVARGALANAQRSSRRRRRLVARVATVDPPPAQEPASEPTDPRSSSVAVALGLLSERDGEALRLWAWEGLEPAAIAGVLAITPNAAALRLSRARRRLRDAVVGLERDDHRARRHGPGQDRDGAGHEGSTGGSRP